MRFLFICLLFLMLGSEAFAADCTGPAHPEGSMNYDSAGSKKFEYCDGTGWSYIADEPSCVQRTNNVNAASLTVSCNAGETMTGGGCSGTGGRQVEQTYPSAAATWTCTFNLADASHTAYAICCTF